MVDHFVGAQNVVAIMNNDLAIKCPNVAEPALMLCFPPYRNPIGWDGLGSRHGKNLLAWVLGKWRVLRCGSGILGGRSLGSAGRERIDKHLRAKLRMTEGQQRDNHQSARMHSGPRPA